jgi:dipeptidyl aminopeptidase/acylaminoacyl peptidase
VDVSDASLHYLTQGRYHDELGNRSADGMTWTFTRGSATRLPEVYAGSIVDGTFVCEKLTSQNEEFFSGLQLVEPEVTWVKSHDGTPVQTWILYPPEGSESTLAPAILDIHGGPHSSYGEAFMHDHQVLAAQGYTVVYSNPRGSKGYGAVFSSAIKERWGEKDWEDIQAVIEQMKRLPGVDHARLGVMGGSYGGYLSNWATSHTTLFKAAVTDRGVSNLISFFGTTDYVRPPETGWEQATPWHHPEKLWNQSPLKYVGDVVTPTLIIHPQGDLRVSIEQAEQWFTALQLRGVPSRFVRYRGMVSHQMTRLGPPDLRLDRLEQIIMWFAEYL